MIITVEYNKTNGHDPLLLDGKTYVRQDVNGNYEDISIALRRFKKAVQKSGRMIEYRKHEFYESKSIKRKRKHENELKRRAKEARKYNKFYDISD